MLRRYPDTLRWRQALPPLFVLSLAGLALVSVIFPLAGMLLASELLLYFGVFVIAGLHAGWRLRKPFLLIGVPLAIPLMHMAWGSGLLWSMLVSLGKNG